MIAKCACSHCGGGIEFEAEHNGTDIDCPHCGCQTTLLATASAFQPKPLSKPSKPFSNPPTAKVVKVPWLRGLGSILQIIGAVNIAAGILVAIGSIASIAIGESGTSRSAWAGAFVAATLISVAWALIGVASVEIGSWVKHRFICSDCQNPIGYQKAKLCPACRVELIPLR